MVLPETVLGHRIHGMGVLEVDGRSHLRMRGILAADPVLWAHQRVCPVLATRAPAPGPHGECRTRQSPALGRRRRGRRRRRELVRDRRERGRRDEQGERHGAEEQAPRVTSSLPRTGGRVGLRPVRARPRPSRAHRSIGARPSALSSASRKPARVGVREGGKNKISSSIVALLWPCRL